MSNNSNSGLNSVIMDQTLFILENYVDIMTITNNTQAQITRQQQAMVRKMNVLITELRRQQTIETASENIRNMSGSFQETSNINTTPNNSRERSPRERIRSRFEQETRNITRELFHPTSRLYNSRNNRTGRRPLRSRASASNSNSRGRSRTTNSVHTQPLFNFSNTSNTSTGNTNGTNNASTTTPFTPRPSSSGILLNFEQILPFGSGSNFPTNGTTFQPSFGRGLFENVPVFPSPEQIETATTSMRFQDISSPINTTCPITMETFSPEQIIVKINHCGHIFNQAHIHGWFRSNVRCPVCRYDIRDYETENSSSTEENTNTTNNASNSINFTPLSSIRETRENEETSRRGRTTNYPPAAGGGESTQESNDDLSAITRVLLQSLMSPTSTENNTLQTPSSQTQISTTTIPVTWSHIIPSVPLSPLTFTQQTTFSPSTGARNNETSPSPDDTHETNDEFTHSIVEPNTQEETDGSADEVLSQD
jgi:hypothetical protein